ncbi:MAG: tetratricopeptide repeat protein [Chloroflexi bacterium]|nr:tetratricopeptide repeat protein [Chloroflexota bacterium]
MTSFVPRAGEVGRVTDRLRASRLVTITGSGGCGKTRLALEVARDHLHTFADGIWLVDLAPLTDASLVSQTIATTLGIRDVPGRPFPDALTDYLRRRDILLILDNCEHVIDACAQVADKLLRSCAYLHVLATSRELLGVEGEATWRVTSLSVLDPDRLASANAASIAELLASEAAQLLVDRARRVVPSFTVTDRNALAVAQVCQRLDGIPLAIELAAARLGMLSVDQIAARLHQRFRLLTGGNRTAVRRQQTLQATVDWSYQLLSEEERTLVRRLAVFAGGWSLEAAEALGADLARPEADVLELLSRLVAKSMVLVDDPCEHDRDVLRYRYLETIRQYADEKLVESGEAESLRTRHRDWYLRLAEEAMEGMEGAEQKSWWDRLELEHDNLRAALTWSVAGPSGSEALLSLVGFLGRFWHTRGYAREGIDWLETALERTEATPSSARARVLIWLGQYEMAGGKVKRATRLLDDSIAQARAVGDRRVLSLALRQLGTGMMSIGDHGNGRRLTEEALAVSRDAGLKREIAWNLGALGGQQSGPDYSEAAEPMLLESVVIGRESGDLTPVIASMRTLGRLYWQRGDVARARDAFQEALALARDIDMKLAISGLLVTLGDIALADRDLDKADGWYRQGLMASSRMAAAGAMAHALRHYAAICTARGDHHEAVRILGAASSVPDPPALRLVALSAGEENVSAVAREELGEDEWSAAWAQGQSLALEQAIADVLGEL